jgi:hypothetical protein
MQAAAVSSERLQQVAVMWTTLTYRKVRFLLPGKSLHCQLGSKRGQCQQGLHSSTTPQLREYLLVL